MMQVAPREFIIPADCHEMLQCFKEVPFAKVRIVQIGMSCQFQRWLGALLKIFFRFPRAEIELVVGTHEMDEINNNVLTVLLFHFDSPNGQRPVVLWLCACLVPPTQPCENHRFQALVNIAGYRSFLGEENYMACLPTPLSYPC